MLVPKKNRQAVYRFLFAEGVCYALKDFGVKHPEIKIGEGEDDFVPNLHVIKMMQSFKSKEYVTERFAWRHYYWFLTDKGIAYLREYLNIPEDVVPQTLMKTNRTFEKMPPRGDRGPRDDRGPRGDRGPRDDRGPRGDRGPRDDRGGYRRVPRRGGPPRLLYSPRGASSARAWPFQQPRASPPFSMGRVLPCGTPHLQRRDTRCRRGNALHRRVLSPAPSARPQSAPRRSARRRPRGDGPGGDKPADKAGAPADFRPTFGSKQG